MKVTILGPAQSGQQELFSLLTGVPLLTVQERPMEVHPGVCQVRDGRIVKLQEMYRPKKTTFARISYLLIPDLNLQGPAKAAIMTELRNADELCFIARAEQAKNAVESFISELVINDLMLVEKRLETLAKDKKRSADLREKEERLMTACKGHLEGGKPLREMSFDPDQAKLARTYQLLSLKPVILVINAPEDKMNDDSLVLELGQEFPYPCVQLSVELEQEISCLPEADRAEFMKEMGITEPAIDKMTRLAFAGLGLISFFTVGEDEVRAWPVRQGASAPEAGSVIHSDLEKGFVRAEMFKYADLVTAGSEQKLKELGKYHLKGRDYIVEDGDILSFRSSL